MAWGDTVNIWYLVLHLKVIPSITSLVFYSFSRQVGIKNGMFFGQAKQLCPNLQAVPYDFHAYKEVARTMYETLARYIVCCSHFRVCSFASVSDTEESLVFFRVVRATFGGLFFLSGTLSSATPAVSSSILRYMFALLRLFR